MYQLKQPLQMLFISNKWAGRSRTKKVEEKVVKNTIINYNRFWPSVVYSIKTTKSCACFKNG